MSMKILGPRPHRRKGDIFVDRANRREKPECCVKSVKFTKRQPSMEAPIECECGWVGVVGEWSAHGERLVVSGAHLRDEWQGAEGWMPNTRLMLDVA